MHSCCFANTVRVPIRTFPNVLTKTRSTLRCQAVAIGRRQWIHPNTNHWLRGPYQSSSSASRECHCCPEGPAYRAMRTETTQRQARLHLRRRYCHPKTLPPDGDQRSVDTLVKNGASGECHRCTLAALLRQRECPPRLVPTTSEPRLVQPYDVEPWQLDADIAFPQLRPTG